MSLLALFAAGTPAADPPPSPPPPPPSDYTGDMQIRFDPTGMAPGAATSVPNGGSLPSAFTGTGTVVSGLNGYGGMEFDGSSNIFQSPDALNVDATNGSWLFCVQTPHTIAASDNYLLAANGIELLLGYNDGSKARIYWDGVNIIDQAINFAADYQDRTRIIAMRLKSGDSAIYADGGAAVGPSANALASHNKPNLRIGGRSGPAALFDGVIHLLDWHSRATIAQINQKGNYWSDRLGLSWADITA